MPSEIIQTRDLCIKNAESLLDVADRELDKGVDHICFHLALLALEEIGKAVLITIGHIASVAGKEKNGLNRIDDHIKKIFWALWGEALMKESLIREEIEQSKWMATTLHNDRLSYLYTDPSNPIDPKDKIKKGVAENLIKLTKARLKLEELKKIEENISSEDIEKLKWFLEATEDIDKRKFIFGSKSLNKLSELRNGKQWIQWIKDFFDKKEKEMHELVVREIERKKPKSDEAFEPKYEMQIRIQSQSHTIRNNAFQKWNEGIKDTKLYKVNKKDMSNFAKSELLVRFTFPKILSIHNLWDHGFFMAKNFVTALNIATKGLFWWNLPKDIESYFEYVHDLEADKGGSVGIGMVKGKRLKIDWNEMRLVLKQENMNLVSIVFGYLMRENEKLKKFLISYALGLTMLSKNDIHLRLEANAFEEFFKSFKEVLIANGDWDGKTDLKKVAKNYLDKNSSFEKLEETIKLGLDLDLRGNKVPKITLTEVIAMKLYCDTYMHLKAVEYFNEQQKRKRPKKSQ